MPREPHVWFRQQTGWWMTTINRTRIKLIKGKDKKAEASRKLRELLRLRDLNPRPESGELTVAAVIDLYLTHVKGKLSPRTFYERKLYLQRFAEAHGFRRVNEKDCLPFHLTSWLDAHPQWESDWTKSHAVAIIHRPFNWAARQRLIAANPFRGVSRRAGSPRRPMTDAEFDALGTGARKTGSPALLMKMVPLRVGTTENPVKMGASARVGGRRSSKVRENPFYAPTSIPP